MKATGIVRRIDDLGRVVIPKGIRRTMRIRKSKNNTAVPFSSSRQAVFIFNKFFKKSDLSE